MDDATASDNCGEVTIGVSSETTAGDAAGNYTIVRTLLQRTMLQQLFRHADHHGPGHHAPEFTFVLPTTPSSARRDADGRRHSPDNCGEVTIEVRANRDLLAGDAGNSGNYDDCSPS